jgi:hypothetical protein
MQKNYQTSTRRARTGRTTPKKVKLDRGSCCSPLAVGQKAQ